MSVCHIFSDEEIFVASVEVSAAVDCIAVGVSVKTDVCSQGMFSVGGDVSSSLIFNVDDIVAIVIFLPQ